MATPQLEAESRGRDMGAALVQSDGHMEVRDVGVRSCRLFDTLEIATGKRGLRFCVLAIGTKYGVV